MSARRLLALGALLVIQAALPMSAHAQKVVDGADVFKRYCVLCHGAKGDGNGPAARLQTPRPANLLLSKQNDQYKELIIRRGGAALGRSAGMPPWGDELDEHQIRGLLNYLRRLRAVQP